MTYYTFPLDFNQLLQGRHLERIEIRRAIHQNIKLILKSFALSYRFDPTFGCVVNKFNARTPPQRGSERAWRDEMRQDIQNNLKDILDRYETRIKVKDVFVDLQDPRKRDTKDGKVAVKVEITGQLSLGRKDRFHWPDSEVAEDAAEILPLVIPVGR